MCVLGAELNTNTDNKIELQSTLKLRRSTTSFAIGNEVNGWEWVGGWVVGGGGNVGGELSLNCRWPIDYQLCAIVVVNKIIWHIVK